MVVLLRNKIKMMKIMLTIQGTITKIEAAFKKPIKV
jgi:hypothetical protein